MFGRRSYFGNDTFGILSFQEIIIWEKIHLGFYPTAANTQSIGFQYLCLLSWRPTIDVWMSLTTSDLQFYKQFDIKMEIMARTQTKGCSISRFMELETCYRVLDVPDHLFRDMTSNLTSNLNSNLTEDESDMNASELMEQPILLDFFLENITSGQDHVGLYYLTVFNRQTENILNDHTSKYHVNMVAPLTD